MKFSLTSLEKKMQKILKIAQREYVETVRTKTFIISLLMTPVIIGAIVLINRRISHSISGPRPPSKVVVADLSKDLSTEIKESFDEYNTSNPERQVLLQELQADESADELAKDKVRNGRLDAYIVLEKDCVEGNGKVRSYTRGSKMSDLELASTVENLLNKAVVNRRCKLRNVSPELLAELRRRVPVENIDISSTAQEKQRKQNEQIVKAMVPFFFMFLMFMGIFGNGQQMLTSIIEEKSSRIIEVLLSAVSPFQLMAGKILGIAGIGLTVIALWGIAAYATANWQGLNIEVPVELMVYFAVYYILGFLLFSSILAAIGSVCNTIKEAQSLMTPISFIFILPMMAWPLFVEHSQGTLARAASFFPLLTPMVMILRISSSSDVSLIEILATMVILAAAVLVMTWIAARVFRTGILMYGKRPKLGEILRWLRQN
jgi:ABC-2 type transport system permease protein